MIECIHVCECRAETKVSWEALHTDGEVFKCPACNRTWAAVRSKGKQQRVWVEVSESEAKFHRLTEDPEPTLSAAEFRERAFKLAMTINPSDLAGDLSEVSPDTIEGLARTLAVVAGGYHFTTTNEGVLCAVVGGDMGYATTNIYVANLDEGTPHAQP